MTACYDIILPNRCAVLDLDQCAEDVPGIDFTEIDQLQDDA